MKKNLVKHAGVYPLLLPMETEYVVASADKRLKDIPETECITLLLQIINLAFAEQGTSPAGTTISEKANYLEAIARLLLTDLLYYFPNVTMLEVAHSVKRGIRRQYGEYYGFSVVAVHGFVAKYLESEVRLEALEKQRRYKLMQQEPEKAPAEDCWKIMKNGLLRCYETYQKSHRIIDCGSINYELLVAAKQINLTNDEKQVIFEAAKVQIAREREQEAINYRLMHQIQNATANDNPIIVAKAKEIALKQYFDTHPELEKLEAELFDGYQKMT